jgi:hypothetical protein
MFAVAAGIILAYLLIRHARGLFMLLLVLVLIGYLAGH